MWRIGCVRCEKSRLDFVASIFCINCTSSHYYAPSFMQLRNNPKCTLTLCNAPKHEFRVQWGGMGAFVVKNPDMDSWHELLHKLHQFTSFCTEFHAVTKP